MKINKGRYMRMLAVHIGIAIAVLFNDATLQSALGASLASWFGYFSYKYDLEASNERDRLE